MVIMYILYECIPFMKFSCNVLHYTETDYHFLQNTECIDIPCFNHYSKYSMH